MTTAQDILNQNTNFAIDQIGNMEAMASLVAQYANTILERANIPLAKFNNSMIVNPGVVSVGTAPQFNGMYVDKGAIGTSADYMTLMENFYQALDPQTKSDVDQAMNGFINAFCPQYSSITGTIIPLLYDGANSKAIPDSVRLSWVNELETKLDNDRISQTKTVLNQPAFGSELPQPCLIAALNDVSQSFNDNLAQARTVIFNRTFEMTLQFKQYCIGVLDGVQSAFRQTMMSYASMYAGLKQFAESLSRSYTEKGLQTRETEIEGFRDRRSAASTLYESVLKAFEANMESYKSELSLKIQSLEKQFEYQRIQLENATIPYKYEMERNFEVARLDLNAMVAVLGAVEHILAAFSSVATASASGLNSLGSVVASE